jgi:fructose-1,6-bisphosphatase/inositol monophosphatase family enzyme
MLHQCLEIRIRYRIELPIVPVVGAITAVSNDMTFVGAKGQDALNGERRKVVPTMIGFNQVSVG